MSHTSARKKSAFRKCCLPQRPKSAARYTGHPVGARIAQSSCIAHCPRRLAESSRGSRDQTPQSRTSNRAVRSAGSCALRSDPGCALPVRERNRTLRPEQLKNSLSPCQTPRVGASAGNRCHGGHCETFQTLHPRHPRSAQHQPVCLMDGPEPETPPVSRCKFSATLMSSRLTPRTSVVLKTACATCHKR